MTKPNILLLVTHDTGQHISPYGINTVATPNCERLAAESVLFENSFCTAPQCSPSRASIVTGRYPHANGTMGLTHADFAWSLHENERPIATLLRPEGYATWLLGGQHETAQPGTLGFDHVDLGFSLDEAVERLSALLGQREPNRPFYCQLGCAETHRPFDYRGTKPDSDRGIHVPPYLNDGPETRREFAQFQGMVKRFDTALGNLLDLLEQSNVLDNTIVVITTDHGIAMPMAKGTLYDPGIETLLFMRYPAQWGTGIRKRELISNVDILPTLLEAIGAGIPANVHGRSFLKLLTGDDAGANDAVFAEKTFHDCYDPMRCIRTDRFKYIRYFEKSSFHRVPGDAISGGANRELGIQHRSGYEELFDIQSDPIERKNLAADPQYAETKADLRKRLAAWMQETGDPLLHGPIASPYYAESRRQLLAD